MSTVSPNDIIPRVKELVQTLETPVLEEGQPTGYARGAGSYLPVSASRGDLQCWGQRRVTYDTAPVDERAWLQCDDERRTLCRRWLSGAQEVSSWLPSTPAESTSCATALRWSGTLLLAVTALALAVQDQSVIAGDQLWVLGSFLTQHQLDHFDDSEDAEASRSEDSDSAQSASDTSTAGETDGDEDHSGGTAVTQDETSSPVVSEGEAASETPDPSEDTGGSDNDQPLGIIYARVSSENQVKNGNGLDDQIERLRGVAEERGIRLVEEPLKDAGKTGRNFDRSGIQRVWELAEKEGVSYLLVDDIDRIGRCAPPTVCYLYVLRAEFDVVVLTSNNEEIDLGQMQDLTLAMMRSLSSQMTNENRTRRAVTAQLKKFQRKNWSVVYSTTPLGYERTDDDWLEVDPEEADLVRDIYEIFVDSDLTGAYTETADELSSRGYDIDRKSVKKIVKRPLYKGEPTVNRCNSGYLGNSDLLNEVSVEDPSLQIIDEERFEQAADKVERIAERYSSGDEEDLYGLEELIAEFGIESVDESSPLVELRCPDCGDEFVKNGQRTLFDKRVHNYLCKGCGKQRKFPTKGEWRTMKSSSRKGV